MKKKGIALFLALTMVLSAGCSSGGGKSQENNQGSQSAAAAKDTQAEAGSKDSKEKVTLTMMAVGGADKEATISLIGEMIDEFNSANEYQAQIQIEWLEDAQYKTKFATLMTQNNMADIFFTWEYGYLKPYVEAGKVMDLTDALNADPQWQERFSEGIFAPLTYNDHIYAIPTGRKMGPVYYNKKIFKECGVEVPETWDEFMDVIGKVKEAGYVPVDMAAQDAWVIAEFFLDIIGGVGGTELYNGIYTGENTWDDPQCIKAGQLLQDLVAAGAFPDNFAGLSYDEGVMMFTSGKAAMYPMGTWVTSAILAEMNPEDVGVFLPPAYEQKNGKAHMSQVEMSWAVSETCKNKEAALGFIKKFSEETYQERFLLEAGQLPATNLQVDAGKIDSVTSEVIALAAQGIDPLTPFDVLLGANVGGEFNNISLAIATGKDPADQFAQLQAYAQSQAD